VKRDGTLELSLVRVATPEPKPEEVIVRIDASLVNPSDQGLLFGGADMSTAKATGTADDPVVTAPLSPAAMKAMAGRLDQSLPVGDEGAGVVVRAGAAPAAQALLGKTVHTAYGRTTSAWRR
jgi:NADPH:quinone reductase-like Zn-dependent oxidoreductase